MEHKLKALDFRLFIGCPCYIFDTVDHPAVPSTVEGIDGTLNMVISERINYNPGVIKLVLRKFESLSRHEVEELNKLWPKENIKRTTFDSIKLDADIINYLTSINVDVFGWIDQGLAIDAAYNSTTQKNMSTNSINRSNDEEIIDIMNNILSNGKFQVETINESVLVKLMELRGTPIKYDKTLRDIDKDYENWKNRL